MFPQNTINILCNLFTSFLTSCSDFICPPLPKGITSTISTVHEPTSGKRTTFFITPSSVARKSTVKGWRSLPKTVSTTI